MAPICAHADFMPNTQLIFVHGDSHPLLQHWHALRHDSALLSSELQAPRFPAHTRGQICGNTFGSIPSFHPHHHHHHQKLIHQEQVQTRMCDVRHTRRPCIRMVPLWPEHTMRAQGGPSDTDKDKNKLVNQWWIYCREYDYRLTG